MDGREEITVGEALDIVASTLEQAGVYCGHGTDNTWDEAVQLVLAVADLPADSDDRVRWHTLDVTRQARLQALLERRIRERIPLPYLLGRVHFAGLQLRCDPRAIIPRSPIAELIPTGLQPWYSGPQPIRLLDLCCGGGCLGLVAAHYLPDLIVDLVDLDVEALTLARENATLLGLDARVRLLQSDLFSAVAGERYDIILSNPPYVDATDLAAMPSEYHHEPALALGSGMDGLDLTRRILAEAENHLQPWGLLVVEVGNSWEALETAYPRAPFTWLAFERGGHGVFVMTAAELREHRASLRQ